jgi:hypothetical protein
MSLGLAFGALVLVRHKLALCGDIVLMKKHSKNIMDTLSNDEQRWTEDRLSVHLYELCWGRKPGA